MTTETCTELRACGIVKFENYSATLTELLDSIGAPAVLARQRRILIKPNLVNMSPPPITLSVYALAALVDYLRQCSQAELVIGEGAGETNCSTHDVFRQQGYQQLARERDLRLVDLNEAPTRTLKNPQGRVFPQMILPEIALESFLISFPVLKAHSLADVTLSMKNMMGLPSHHHYQQGGAWRKAAFHARMHQSIYELNLYRAPDLAIIDATVGMAEYHLGGPHCDPPVNRLVAGFDPVAVDAAGASLLGFDWREVEHIRRSDGVLGAAGKGAVLV